MVGWCVKIFCVKDKRLQRLLKSNYEDWKKKTLKQKNLIEPINKFIIKDMYLTQVLQAILYFRL